MRFRVERIGDAADRALRSFLVNIPALEMLDRPAFITINGGWMIGPAFISAPTAYRRRVRSRRECPRDHLDRVIGIRQRKYADRKPFWHGW